MGVHSLAEFPLTPAPHSKQEPTKRPLSFSEAGSWMRSLLRIDHSDKSPKFTSHSLKATMLSYAAKRGCTFEDRLSLGYHTQPLRVALTYSRDGASRPLRVLMEILREIRAKQFMPDDSRSGRF